MKRPLFISALLGAITVIAVFYCHAAIFAAILILAAVIILAIHKNCFKKFAVILLAVMSVCAGVLYEFSAINRIENNASSLLSEDFVITEEPEKLGSIYGATGKCISGHTLEKGDKVKLYFSSADVTVGDNVGVIFTLNSLSGSEYKMYYYSEGVYASGNVEKFYATNTHNSVLTFVPKLKKEIKNILIQSMSFENQAFVAALTIGDKADFSEDFDVLVRNTGTSHIMVVSGMHLVILMGGLMSIINRLFYNKYAYFAIALGGVLLLSAVCGFTMSVIRAGVTYILIMAAPLFDRDADALNTLGATVTIVLIFSPFAVFSIAFQLSVLSTFGILATAPFISETLCRMPRIRKKFLRKTVEIISVTVAATVMTAPICVYHFGSLSLTALLVNLLITHAVTAVLLFSAVGIIIALIFGGTAFSNLILSVADILSSFIVGLISYVGSFKYSSISINKHFFALFVALAAALLALRAIRKREQRRLRRKAW